MAPQGDPDSKKKQTSWKIPVWLRHRLNSHAEYLAAEAETDDEADTEGMVAEWLEDRLKIEERKRARRILEGSGKPPGG